jgi:hypothetical protein
MMIKYTTSTGHGNFGFTSVSAIYDTVDGNHSGDKEGQGRISYRKKSSLITNYIMIAKEAMTMAKRRQVSKKVKVHYFFALRPQTLKHIKGRWSH